MSENFSYSKVDCFKSCKYKYKLVYRDGHYIDCPSIATDFGTLIHYVEETMANIIKTGGQLSREAILDILYNIQDDKEKIYGVNILRKRYPEAWMELDKSGRTYEQKVNEYVENGMFRLYDYMMRNPNLEIVGIEQEFYLDYNGVTFHGFIDRVFQDKDSKHLYIEDIKTWNTPADKADLATPLQFVLYTLAATELYKVDETKISCAYELPLCDMKQPAGTKGYMKRGLAKLDKLLENIASGDFTPSPSPLCHWCIFSGTYPNQPEEAKKLCPYYSHWTRENPVHTKENDWLGPEEHFKILDAFVNGYKQNNGPVPPRPIIDLVDPVRRFIVRR